MVLKTPTFYNQFNLYIYLIRNPRQQSIINQLVKAPNFIFQVASSNLTISIFFHFFFFIFYVSSSSCSSAKPWIRKIQSELHERYQTNAKSHNYFLRKSAFLLKSIFCFYFLHSSSLFQRENPNLKQPKCKSKAYKYHFHF